MDALHGSKSVHCHYIRGSSMSLTYMYMLDRMNYN
jgi:hypothetical protein